MGEAAIAQSARPLIPPPKPVQPIQPLPTIPLATAAARLTQRQAQEALTQPENYDFQRYPLDTPHETHWRKVLWATAVVEPPANTPAGEAAQRAIAQILSLSNPSASSPIAPSPLVTPPLVTPPVGIPPVETPPPIPPATQQATQQATQLATQTRLIEQALQVAAQRYLAAPTPSPVLQSALVQTLEQTTNPKWAALALAVLAQRASAPTGPVAAAAPGTISKTQLLQWRDRLQTRFPRWRTNPHLLSTFQALTQLTSPGSQPGSQPLKTPPLADLLAWQAVPGQFQIYVLCPADRASLCQAILKDGKGQWLRQSPGSKALWSVPLVGRSLYGLPAIFTNGQTPQGLYRIEGTIPQPDQDFFRAYGFYALIQLFVPHEPGVKAFLPDRPGPFTGSLTDYQALLPPSWRNYVPLQESYWAGKAGRGEFRIHGTGEAPTFFTNTQRYPKTAGWNPALGCLSALERYDDRGQLLQADMPKILTALAAIGGGPSGAIGAPGAPGAPKGGATSDTSPNGYLLVVNADPMQIQQLVSEGIGLNP